MKSSCGTNFKGGVFVLYLLLIHLSSPDWDLKLQEVLGETLSLKTSEDAYGKIRSMLATLGDPFTRIVSPQVRISFGDLFHVSLFLQESKMTLTDVCESRSNLVCVSLQEYASFRINNEGALEGVGLLIASDRDSGRLVSGSIFLIVLFITSLWVRFWSKELNTPS